MPKSPQWIWAVYVTNKHRYTHCYEIFLNQFILFLFSKINKYESKRQFFQRQKYWIMPVIHTLKLLSSNDATILTEKSNLLIESHYNEFKFLANLCQNLELDVYRRKSINKTVKYLKAQLAYFFRLWNCKNTFLQQ